MKKTRLRYLSLALCALLVLAMTACGTPTATPTAAPTTAPAVTTAPVATAPAQATAAPVAEPMEISWMCFNQYDIPYEGTSNVQQMIEEMFNVKIAVPLVDTMSQEKMAAFFASGEAPDLINGNVMSAFFHQLADQGVIRTIERDWLTQYAPDWMNNLYAMGLTDSEMDSQIIYNGECWMMPMVNVTFKQTFIAGIRTADLAAAGMSAPPKTLDEYHDLMVALSDKANNVYANHGTVNGNFNFAYAAYDYAHNQFMLTDDGNSVYLTSATDRYKEVLELLAGWYAEGLIDPEYITDNRDLQRSKWADGKLRILIDHPWWWDTATNGSIFNLLDAKGEEQTFFGAVEGPYGNKSIIRTPNMNNNGMYFGADTSDEKVQRIMQIKNELARDTDFWISCFFGEEGKTWEKKPSGSIGFMASTTPDVIEEWGLNQQFALNPTTFERLSLSIAEKDMVFYELSDAQTKIIPSIATSAANKASDERWADVNSVVGTYMSGVITGKLDLNSTWDQYLKDLDANGLPAIISGYEEVMIK